MARGGRVLICGLLGLVLLAGNSYGSHDITAWRDNRAGAISLTFDDNVGSQISIGVPALNERGFKGTFFLITDYAAWSAWGPVSGMGHEIGSHSKTHALLPELLSTDPAAAEDEIVGSKAAMDAMIAPRKCVSFAYPGGQLNDGVRAIVQNSYIGARGVSCMLNGAPFDLYDVNTCFPETPQSLDQMKVWTDGAEQEGKWLVVGFHNLDGTYGSWPTTDFYQYMDYVKGKGNLWVAPFGSVVKYIRERGAATVLASETPTEITLSLTDTLEDALYDEPLTIRSEVPASWVHVSVQQGSDTEVVASGVEGGQRVVYYNAVPDRGLITLTQASIAPPVITTNGGEDFATANPVMVLEGTCSAMTDEILVNGSTQGVTYVSGATTWGYTGTLAAGVNVYEVKARDSHGVESEAATIGVTYDSAAPVKVVLITPSANVWYSGSPPATVSLTWNPTTDVGASGIHSYELSLDGTLIEVGMGTQYGAAVTPGVTHSWRVRALDNAGNVGEWSNTWGFMLRQVVSTVASVYEDGEDGTTAGWEFYVPTPGATIANVYDSERASRVIVLTGRGLDTAYMLLNGDGSLWDNTQQFTLQWSMRYAEPYTIYVMCDTLQGRRYLSYTAEGVNHLKEGDSIHHGLGGSTADGQWHTVTRDLQADLKEGEPTNSVTAVQAFIVRGSGRFDDVLLMAKPPKPKPLVYVSSNPTNWVDRNEYIAVVDPAARTVNYLPYTYDYYQNPDGWANPDGMTFLGKRLFITGFIPGTGNPRGIWEIDPVTGRELFYFPTDLGRPRGLASDGKDLFVSQYFGTIYSIYKFTPSGALLDRFAVPADMYGLAYGRGFLYASSRNTIYKIDLRTKAVVRTFSVAVSSIGGLDFVEGTTPYLLLSVPFSSTIYRVGLDSSLNPVGNVTAFCGVPAGYNNAVAFVVW